MRINIFRDHRQTIQYIDPADSDRLGQAELLVIDEAAAIPLPYVRKLLGNYLVFMSSTINGYEGTGRSLSLKLLSQLRKSQHKSVEKDKKNDSRSIQLSGRRVLREVTLDVPIRYAENDPIESWLNSLLCLDSTKSSFRIITGIPHPSKCELFHVNRDSLFSYHKVSEAFLQRMMALYVSSHYKNTPNDLQMMCDAPAHELFVLSVQMLVVLVLYQIFYVFCRCVKREKFQGSYTRIVGPRQRCIWRFNPMGNVSAVFRQQFWLSVRSTCCSDCNASRCNWHGLRTRAIELLEKYFQGDIVSISENDTPGSQPNKKERSDVLDTTTSKLREEKLSPEKNMPPLLTPLDQRTPERLHYLGVSYGVTTNLFNFWGKAGLSPFI